MRGERFKRRLPKFVGKIPDLDDTFYAEDKEFYRIDTRLDQFMYGLIASLMGQLANPMEFLEKFENDYGLDGSGSIDDRIKEVLLKIGAKKTTTEEIVLDICKAFSLPAIYTEKYREYAFVLDLVISEEGVDLDKLHKAIREVVPAHLEDRVNIYFGRLLKLVSRHGMGSYKIWLCGEHPCGDIPYIRNVGVREDIDLKIKAGLNAAKQYYPRTGDNLKSAEAYDFSPAEIWYSQDVASTRVIKFTEDDK